MPHSIARTMIAAAAGLLAACAAPGSRPNAAGTEAAAVRNQVVAAERAFAKTMADRDLKAFTGFLSDEAVFFSGARIDRGPAAIAAAWKPFFDGAAAPFSWAPDEVEVLPSGKLALSTGPVYIQGKEVSRFNSIWRLEAPGRWRVVFDKGEAVCAAHP